MAAASVCAAARTATRPVGRACQVGPDRSQAPEQAGDSELAGYFRQIQDDDRQRAQRAKDLLLKRLG